MSKIFFLNQPPLVMHSRGETLSTTLKVVTALCYKTPKQIQKKHGFGNLGKFQTVKTFTQYLKFTTSKGLATSR